MRKIVKALLAASMLVPAAAQAQEVQLDAGLNAGQSRRAELRDIRDRARTERNDQTPQADRGDRGPQRRDESSGQPRPERQPDFAGRQDRGDDRPDRQPGFAERQDRGPDRDITRTNRGNDWRQAIDDRDRSRQQSRIDRQGARNDWRDDRRDDDRDGFRDDRRPVVQRDQPWRTQRWGRGGDWRDNGYARGGLNDSRNWSRGWRSDNRYDYDRYRRANRGAFNLPRYYAPSGWSYGYRRFSIGASLSTSLWEENYWIDDPWTYRLPDAYGPYRWVRYYDDALLVDIRTGRVIDIVNDIFY